MLDIAIRNGEIVDGTGRPRLRADVGIAEGRIVELGEFRDTARRVIDAEGLVVAPGFVDIHTHYDPHVMWDPLVTPSSLHGVTTVFGGNCGFSLAPVNDVSAEYLLPMLARVEGMPLAALEASVIVGWSSFGEWLERLDGAVAVNVGFLVGHSTVRRAIMGEDAILRVATEAEIHAMARLVHESLDEGAMGFSSSWAQTHVDHNGTPVPSRWASAAELLSLCRAVRDHEGTTVEYVPSSNSYFSPETCELLTSMSLAANRPLNWNLLRISADEASRRSAGPRLAASDQAAVEGGRVVPLTLPEPLRMLVNFSSGFPFDTLGRWADVMRLPLAWRLKQFADPSMRMVLADARIEQPQVWTNWPEFRLMSVENRNLQDLVGRKMVDLASESSRDPFDVMLDIVEADDGMAIFEAAVVGDDDESWRLRVEVAQDPRVIVGGSDAGAHLDMLQTFACQTRFLAGAVRERGLLRLEDAVRLFTDAPARLYGVESRGRLATGWHADVVIFDEMEVGPGAVEFRRDMPGGGGRLYSEPTGVAHVLVNGVEIVNDGEPTGLLPGRVLRSGRDTKTVPIGN